MEHEDKTLSGGAAGGIARFFNSLLGKAKAAVRTRKAKKPAAKKPAAKKAATKKPAAKKAPKKK